MYCLTTFTHVAICKVEITKCLRLVHVCMHVASVDKHAYNNPETSIYALIHKFMSLCSTFWNSY